jgi:D-glycero-D-manno-heptose 1,7-bisphosphate phosphatase
MKRRRFVVLDRDGTVIVERHYLSDPEQVELIPGAAEGLRRLAAYGLGLVLLTNQSAVGRGWLGLDTLEEVHRRMKQLLEREDVRLAGIYVCPHAPDEGCNCRKPLAGLLERAAAELDFAPAECFVIGDKACDIDLGRRAGATTFLVRTGYGAELAAAGAASADYVVDDLAAAAKMIEQLLSEQGDCPDFRGAASENGTVPFRAAPT